MKRYMALPRLTLTSSLCHEEEDKLLMLEMDLIQNLMHKSKKIKKILVKVELTKKFTVLPQLILTFFRCQEGEDKLHMPVKDPMRKLIH
jgi:hypothetical protein